MTNDRLWLFKSYADQDDVQAVTDVIERGTWWANGAEIETFENQVATLSDREYGVAFNSGTSALFAVLEALDVEGSEVIVPSFTYPATANAVVAAGGKPVFADIERDSLSLDADDVVEKISGETAAIVPVHISGNVSRDIRALQTIADDHDVALVEDGAHSLGATYESEPVGSFGTAATYSFAFNKLVATGEGGMLVTDSESLVRSVSRIRHQGRDDRKRYIEYGYNLQMSSITAALGASQMRKIEELIAERQRMARYLNDELSDIAEITVPRTLDSQERVYLFYNLRVSDPNRRDELRRYLDDRGIPTRITYEPVHLTPYYRTEWGYSSGDLPVTEHVSARIVTLPFHLDLSTETLDRLAAAIKSFFPSS